MAPAEAGEAPAGQRYYIPAGKEINGVKLSVEGLRGAPHAAALASANDIRSAKTLGELDERVQVAAKKVADAAVAHGDAAIAEVSAPAGDGSVQVCFRPPPGIRAAWDAGLHSQRGSCCMGFAGRSDLGSDLAWRLDGIADVGRNLGTLNLRVFPLNVAGFPTFELTTMNSPKSAGTSLKANAASVSIADQTGCHSVRLEVAVRDHDLQPDQPSAGANRSQEVLQNGHDAPPYPPWLANKARQEELLQRSRSSKVTLRYSFFDDSRSKCEDHEEFRQCSMEVAGGFGDVALARMDGLWTCTKRNLASLSRVFWPNYPSVRNSMLDLKSAELGLSGSASFVLPVEGATLDDCLFLGGARGGPAERLPGFEDRCVGPSGNTSPGAQMRLTGSANMQWPIPRCGQLQALAFASAGTVAHAGRFGLVGDLFRQARASVGVGVSTTLPNGGLVGLACSQPLFPKPFDKTERLQFWISFKSPM